MSEENKKIVVTCDQLPLHCPVDSSPLWSRHPRVFLDVIKTGEVVCPYCSAHYIFQGEKPKGMH